MTFKEIQTRFPTLLLVVWTDEGVSSRWEAVSGGEGQGGLSR